MRNQHSYGSCQRGSALSGGARARDAQGPSHTGAEEKSKAGRRGGGTGTHLIRKIGLDLVVQLPVEGGEKGAGQGAAGSLWGQEVRRGPTTHSVPALFSEKKRSTKSPSLLGSKVEGTTTYSPGGRRKRVLTSRRLMNCSDRARDELARKKSRFRCTAGWPTSW